MGCNGVLCPIRALSDELVLAENGASSYQIVIPDRAADEVVDQWLLLAANLTDGVRYDAVMTFGAGQKKEDVAWNGQWEVVSRTTGEKRCWSLPGRIWTAWFRIPFAELGGAAPVSGETWGFNAARDRWGSHQSLRYLLWRDAPSVTDPEALGTLVLRKNNSKRKEDHL